MTTTTTEHPFPLEPQAIYILLFARPGSRTTFHWALYLHTNPHLGGLKLHIRNLGHTWMTDHSPIRDVLKSFLLIGLMRIGSARATPPDDLARVITAEDGAVNEEEGTTCRVYVARACERLRGKGVLVYPGWEALEREVVEWGLGEWEGCERCVQPRPVVVASCCE